jgi:hypothetical protein
MRNGKEELQVYSSDEGEDLPQEHLFITRLLAVLFVWVFLPMAVVVLIHYLLGLVVSEAESGSVFYYFFFGVSLAAILWFISSAISSRRRDD